MAEPMSDQENELNFSDYEADSDEENQPRPPTTSVIAHKEMKTVQISDAEDDSDKDDSDQEDSDKEETNQELEFESISPPAEHSDDEEIDQNINTEPKITSTVLSCHESENQTFEPISPVSDHGNFETISPPASPLPHSSTDTQPQFENISEDEDEEDNKKTEELPEGKFSPVQESDHELVFNDESSNDSGYHIIQKAPVEESVKTEEKIDDSELPDDVEEDDIEAPMPSPFSDIGDCDLDMTESDGQIISDILKDTDATEQQFEFKNEMFSGKTIPTEENSEQQSKEDLQEEEDIEVSKENEEVADVTNEDDHDACDLEKVDEEKADEEKAYEEKDDEEKDDEEKDDEEKDEEEDEEKDEEKYEENNEKDEEKDWEKDEEKDGEKAEEQHGVVAADDAEDDDDADQVIENVAEEVNKDVIAADEDSEDEEIGRKPAKKKNVIVEDTDEVDQIDQSKDEDEPEKDEEAEKEKEDKKDEEEEEGEDAGDLIADIFGESDEEEEFEGFADEEMPEGDDKEESDVEEVQPVKPAPPVEEEKKDESSDDEPQMPARDFVNDFEVMLQKKKAEKRIKRNLKKDVDIISDNDEIIANMIKQMKDAAEEDRMLNQAGKAATKKLKMLPAVVKSIRKNDLQMTFIDCGVLGGIKEWLTPLPDHALPHIHIRKLMLQILTEFPPLDKSSLKSSGIGRAVMLLFKHPKETRENKYVAGKIISNWARPIFNVSTNFMDVSKEEREERDKKTLMNTKRRESDEVIEPKRTKLEEEDNENKPRRPGDPGWCYRARVPQASHRDYVNRPVSKVDAYEQTRTINTKKPLNRYEKHALKMKNKRPGSKVKAMDISLSGSKMGL